MVDSYKIIRRENCLLSKLTSLYLYLLDQSPLVSVSHSLSARKIRSLNEFEVLLGSYTVKIITFTLGGQAVRRESAVSRALF